MEITKLSSIERSEMDDYECPICKDKLINDKNYVITECKHKFHFSCLLYVLKINSKCPICRNIISETIIIGNIIQRTQSILERLENLIY